MLFQIKSYLQFLWNSKNEHGVHSPFVFLLVTKCFYAKTEMKPYFSNFQIKTKKEKQLLLDKMIVLSKDLYRNEKALLSIKDKDEEIDLDDFSVKFKAMAGVNTIGFEKSKALKENSVVVHKSMALDITKKRLQMISSSTNQKADFSIEEIKQISDKSKITSIHVYVGTDFTDITYFMNGYSALIKIAKYFPNLNSLNFGGGFGVSENGEKTFDIDEYNSQLNKLLEVASKNLGRDLSIILEPGRIIGANSGYFICNVSDIKKKDNSILVGVNASIAQFPRPLMYPDLALDPVKVVRDGKVLSGKEQHVSIIYGNSTYSRDIFRKNITRS